MSRPRPITPERIHEFDSLIDARSPSEFALDHIPGAVNCPVLDDDERRIVGTLYKQQGTFEAKRVGGAMVAAQLARHLRESFADKPKSWRPLVYCWRGGMRSGTMVQWLRLVGWDAQQLHGGYKAFRAHVMERIATLAPQLKLQVICGPTGSAKTALLQALRAEGAQVLDLEALARHKGSILGRWPGQEQPSQKAFETALAQVLQGFDLARPVFVEAESRKIGRLMLPDAVLDALRGADCIAIEAPAHARLAYLLQDYAYLGKDGEELAILLGQLNANTGLHAKETIARWQTWARAGQLAPLFEALMTEHYDPLYARSQRSNYLRLAQARPLALPRLEAQDLALAARQLMA